VLLFDAWFFLGNGEAAAPVADASGMDVPLPPEADGGFHLADLLGGGETPAPPGHAAIPWADPATWPLPERRAPRRGRPRPDLMVRRDPPAIAGEGDALPTAVPVILWRPEGALALLGGHLVREGDRLGPWRVAAIEPDRVRLAREDDPATSRVLLLGRTPAEAGAAEVAGPGTPGRPQPVPAAGTGERPSPAPPGHEEVP